MTPAQTAAHFRLWRRVCHRHGWRMERGRLQSSEAALNHFSSQVWRQAATIAQADARAATVDDLRHSLYFLACGQVTSRRVNSGHHATRLFGWLRLCLDDTDIEAAGMAEQTAAGHTGQLSGPVAIRRLGFPESYIATVAKTLYSAELQGGSWESLPLPVLRNLYKLLRSRLRRQS